MASEAVMEPNQTMVNQEPVAPVEQPTDLPPKKKRKGRKKGSASLSAIASFCSAEFSLKATGEMISSYFILFLTDFMMLPTIQITAFMLITRIIDACTDPMVGALVDMTHTKWGKARPYMLFSPLPLALFTVLMFTVPNFSMMGRLVYTYVVYIGFGLAQTFYSVPMMSLSLSMSADPKERKNFYTFAGITGTVATSIPGLVPIVLQYVAHTHSEQEKAYFIFAVVLAVIGAVTMLWAFFAMKENVVPIAAVKKEKVKISKNLACVVKNRPLMCQLLSAIAQSLRTMGYGAAIYFYTVTLGNIALATFVGIVSSIPTYIVMLSVPLLAKKFDPRNLMIASYLFTAAAFLLLFFIGYQSIFWVAFFIVISGAPNGISRTCTNIIVADSVDYMEWRTGVRAEGLVFSISSLKGKASQALSGMWLPLGLTIIGYRTAMSSAEFVIQSDATKQGLFYLVTLAPMVGSLLAAFFLFFDNFYGKRRQQAFDELAERRAQAQAQLEAEKAAENGEAVAESSESEAVAPIADAAVEEKIEATVTEESAPKKVPTTGATKSSGTKSTSKTKANTDGKKEQ